MVEFLEILIVVVFLPILIVDFGASLVTGSLFLTDTDGVLRDKITFAIESGSVTDALESIDGGDTPNETSDNIGKLAFTLTLNAGAETV